MTSIYINKNTKEATEDLQEARRQYVEEGADMIVKMMDGKRTITKYEWKHGNARADEYMRLNYEANKRA